MALLNPGLINGLQAAKSARICDFPARPGWYCLFSAAIFISHIILNYSKAPLPPAASGSASAKSLQSCILPPIYCPARVCVLCVRECVVLSLSLGHNLLLFLDFAVFGVALSSY